MTAGSAVRRAGEVLRESIASHDVPERRPRFNRASYTSEEYAAIVESFQEKI